MMISKNISTIGDQSFEDLKQSNEHDAEYWSARDLQPLLGYSQWRRFEDAVKRAITSCEQSGNNPGHHFAGTGKMIGVGKGGAREVDDYQLSRFACYLIAQNGDPRKPEIAYAQKYFAIQARKQELSEQLAADQERLDLRKQTTEEFKALSGAARQAGVQDKMFGVFHDAGYKGLYGGLGGDAIKTKKNIPAKEQLLDRMSSNSFRDFVLEQLASLYGLRCKRMFGGHGLYSGEQFFGIVYDGRLYFKTHPDTLPDYLSQHASVFAPSENQVLKNYREVPVDVLEDAAELNAWARKAANP